MQVIFVHRSNGPQNLVCDAEVIFDDTSRFSRMKLVGFALWRDQAGDLYVTFPCRGFGAGPERRYFDLLRPVDPVDLTSAKAVRSWILAEYRRSPGPSEGSSQEPEGKQPSSRPKRKEV